jgi:hypothetical protein
MTCFPFELLSRIPVAGLRLSLCRRHVERCPRCRRESGEAPPSFLVHADQLPPGLDLWPGVKRGIDGRQGPVRGHAVLPPPARGSWRWAVAAAVATLLLLAGFWINGRRTVSQPGPSAAPPVPQTRLCSAKIGDRPARVFQVQSRNPDRSIFWIARENSRS